MPDHRIDDEAIGAAIRSATAGVGAPPELRARIARDRAQATARRPVRVPLLIGAVGVLAALAAALVLVLWPGETAAPSVDQAARAALAAPTAAAPPVDPADPRFVRASMAGIRFPNYAYDSPWRTVGGRADTLGDRPSRTVTYSRGPVRVGYTIIDGRPLAAPAGARTVEVTGWPVRVARIDGALVVSWERGGHTCVLATRTATLEQLLGFVAWRGDA